MLFEELVLKSMRKFKGERTVSGIYNLLTGKRSSQTMQDAKGYQLDIYFGIYPELNREALTAYINYFIDKGDIFLANHSFPQLTDQGRKKLAAYQGPILNAFNGMEQHAILPSFEKRFLLFTQTATNMTSHITSFVPIIDDPATQRWVKQVYVKYQTKMPELVKSLHKEIETILNGRSTLEADLFTFRLTGRGVIGLTYEQLKERHSLSEEDVYIGIRHMFYLFFNRAKKEPKKYPVLSLFTSGLEETHLITNSAQKTYQYLEQGLSMDEIITLRRLKKSTIQDHIIEAALVIPTFPSESFISEEEIEKIKKVARQLDTQRLKHIHQALDGEFDYFQLRLAMAKAQHEKEKGIVYDTH